MKNVREHYLEKIRPYYDIDLIKVLTGIRRCGKSIIMNQIIDEIKSLGVKDDHIIYINFEDFEYEDVKEAKEFNQLVKNNIIDSSIPAICLFFNRPITGLLILLMIRYFPFLSSSTSFKSSMFTRPSPLFLDTPICLTMETAF